MFHGELGKDPAFLERLARLRERIDDARISPSVLDQTLNIATWNIREFGKVSRGDVSIHFLAEVINEFDLVSVVELRDRLGDLRRLTEVLGDYWKVVYSDYRTDSAGNRERIAFLYDSRSVRFSGLAAEANPPRVKDGDLWHEGHPDWWRSPYMASFTAGSFDFILCCAHIRWGSSDKARQEEIQAFADWVKERQADRGEDEKDWIVMGDFNIASPAMLSALRSCGFHVPAGLATGVSSLGTDLGRGKAYDQILHSPSMAGNVSDKGGVVDFFTGDFRPLYPEDGYPDMDRQAFTFQMSDHLPLWIQIRTDIVGNRIAELVGR